jgi:hypothetical protein
VDAAGRELRRYEGILLRRLEADQPALGDTTWEPCPQLPNRRRTLVSV